MDRSLPRPTTMTTTVLPIYDVASANSKTTVPTGAVTDAGPALSRTGLSDRRDSDVSLGSEGSSFGGSVVNGMGKEMDLVPIFED